MNVCYWIKGGVTQEAEHPKTEHLQSDFKKQTNKQTNKQIRSQTKANEKKTTLQILKTVQPME